MRITQLLSSSSFLVVNKDLCKKIGIVPAVVLSELCSEFEFYRQYNRLVDKRKFFCTTENMLENLGIKRVQLDSSLTLLETLGLIKITREGVPCKRYFELNEHAISVMLDNDSPVCSGDKVAEKFQDDENSEIPSSDERDDESYAEKEPMAVVELNCEPVAKEQPKLDKKTAYTNRLKELNKQENWGYTDSQIEFYYNYMSSRNWLDNSGFPVDPANIAKHCCKALGAILEKVKKKESGIRAKEKIECKRKWEDALCRYWDTRQIDILLKDKNFESMNSLDKYCEMITKTKAHYDNTNSLIKRFGEYDGHRLNENRYCEEQCSVIMPRELLRLD